MRSNCTPELGITASKGIDRLPARFQQEIIGCSLMLPEQGPQFSRYCEGDQEILHRQQLGSLSFNPLLAFMMLAMGATAMAAGMGDVDTVLTIGTLQHHQVAALTAAASHRLQGLAMTRQ
jgi:hypothetical protein